MTIQLHPRWYVSHTHPHAEAKAAAHLNRQGFESQAGRRRVCTKPSKVQYCKPIAWNLI